LDAGFKAICTHRSKARRRETASYCPASWSGI
jgi:hypothetical protein